MNVTEAKHIISEVTSILQTIDDFYTNHPDLQKDTNFLCDAVGYLCDYRKVLEKAIGEATLNI